MAEATYAKMSPPATQVARPPVWSRNSGPQQRLIAPRHRGTATRSGPRLRPSQVPVRPANLEFAYGVSLDGNVAGPGDGSQREADRLASSVADAGSFERGGPELGRSAPQIAAAAGGTEPSVHLAAADHVVQRWPGDMHATARRDGGRPMNAHPDAVATSPEAHHDSWPLAYELAMAGFRPKLKVGRPGDVYEQEADNIADRVMRSPAGDASGSPGGQCCSGCASGVGCSAGLHRAGSPAQGSEVSSATESRVRSGDSTGQPLPGPTRAFFELRFGRDFGDVRVHCGPDAAQLSEDLQAHAFTHGSHIWLGSGLSPEPSRVLAHELTHVVQQVGPTAAASTGYDPEPHAVQHQRSGTGPGTLQRTVCLGGHWRHADTDPTALEAYDKIERAYKALKAAVNDPAVSEQSKMEMVEAIQRSIDSLRSYINEIEGTCSSSSGGASLMLGTTATGVDPLQAAIALFAVLLVGSMASRMSMPEQHAVEDLSNAMTQLANAVRNLAEPVRMPTEKSTPAPDEPPRTADPIPPVLPRPDPDPREDDRRRRRRCPPFVLRVPAEKAPHLDVYRKWLGVLQDDPKYERGQPAQLDKWRQAHRIGGAHAIPAEVYERGHKLGLTGEEGENRIRVPDWTRTRGPRVDRPKAPEVKIAVDHKIELQVTPASMRDAFDSVDNYELLTETANVASRNRIRANINAERAKQVACDSSKKDQVLTFDRVELGDGQPAERWTSEEIRSGEQLDAYS
jgi:Domain of unknown function (DUF4157)